MSLLAQSVTTSTTTTAADAVLPWNDWQTQMLDLVDPDDMSEQAYARLLEMLDDLDLERRFREALANDSLHHRRYFPHQTFHVGGDQCLNRREGYRNPTDERRRAGKAYYGDAMHGSARYDLDLRQRDQTTWRAGLVLDKDAGEAWRHRPPLADSYSLYASVTRRHGVLRQAVVGHYRLALGCGLLCDQSFSLGKSVLATSWMTKRATLAVHSSTSETDYMQGAAARLRLGTHWELVPFLSARAIDGSLRDDTLTAWATDGYHRTHNERAKRHASWFYNAGTRLKWLGENGEVAANILYSQFQHPFERPLQRYNAHYFRGQRLTQGSLDYEWRWMGLHLKGETAVNDGGGWATTDAVSRTLGSGWQATALYRHYSDGYRQLLSNALAESSAMQGERGVTVLVDGEVTSHWNIQLMADRYRFTQAQYGIYAPSRGYEMWAKAFYHASTHTQDWRATMRYRLRHKRRNDSLTADVPDDLTPYYLHSIDGQCDWRHATGLSLRTQCHARFFSIRNVGGVDQGIALSQTIGYRREGFPLRGEVQGTWFRTDNYDCRLYIAEANVRYGFGIPMLYGKGMRVAALLSCHIGHNLTLEAKYARVQYRGADAISTGLQRIGGNHQDNVWVQCGWKW